MRFDHGSTTSRAPARIQTARVSQNRSLCRAHYRLTFSVSRIARPLPGQFVHLCAVSTPTAPAQQRAPSDASGMVIVGAAGTAPLLRRAFSIAGVRVVDDSFELDVIYRVVGRGTRGLETLTPGAALSVLGPLGNAFPISSSKRNAWMIAGGVGLPPMLYLAEGLKSTDRMGVAFCGTQSRDLLALTLEQGVAPSTDARSTPLCASEFARYGIGAVISTDDGSLGFAGHVGAAMTAYADAHPVDPDDLVVYACGPERMMRFVASFCAARSIECYVCMERAMACGTGMCQSCVVPVIDRTDASGWVYRLCCTDGPVFAAADVIWDTADV